MFVDFLVEFVWNFKCSPHSWLERKKDCTFGALMDNIVDDNSVLLNAAKKDSSNASFTILFSSCLLGYLLMICGNFSPVGSRKLISGRGQIVFRRCG